MKNGLLLCLGMAMCTTVLSQEWQDIPSSSGAGRYQIKPGSMFSVRDETPLKTLYYGVELRIVSTTGKVIGRETIAFKESDCDKSSGVVHIEYANKTQNTKHFSKHDGTPYGVAAQVVCNVTRQLLK